MTVFFDVDTQLDFVSPAGSLYVPGAEKRIPAIAALNRRAPRLISTVDAHSEDDVEFKSWPPHCVLGTLGQRKPSDLLVPKQIIFEKVTTDAFLNPRLLPLLAELNADRYVVYGVVTEICVRFAALGLLATGKPVDIVTDAIEALSPEAAEAFFKEVTARGARLVTSADVEV
ncbi:MAG TPA: isochorismatase family protein [Bryobacteraceae bacterium]|jgi:nicotinamidase/pyrazinamidase